VVLNKMELCDEARLKSLAREVEDHTGQAPLVISAAASQGLDALLAAVWKQLGIV
jgi:GTP-binding protein